MQSRTPIRKHKWLSEEFGRFSSRRSAAQVHLKKTLLSMQEAQAKCDILASVPGDCGQAGGIAHDRNRRR
jgi:hypothetical protein